MCLCSKFERVSLKNPTFPWSLLVIMEGASQWSTPSWFWRNVAHVFSPWPHFHPVSHSLCSEAFSVGVHGCPISQVTLRQVAHVTDTAGCPSGRRWVVDSQALTDVRVIQCISDSGQSPYISPVPRVTENVPALSTRYLSALDFSHVFPFSYQPWMFHRQGKLSLVKWYELVKVSSGRIWTQVCVISAPMDSVRHLEGLEMAQDRFVHTTDRWRGWRRPQAPVLLFHIRGQSDFFLPYLMACFCLMTYCRPNFCSWLDLTFHVWDERIRQPSWHRENRIVESEYGWVC